MVRIKELYYAPGIISLLLLPLLFWYHIYSLEKQYGNKAITVYWFDSSKIRKHEHLFPDKKIIAKRDYTHIELTGDPTADNIKLNYAQIRIREIIQSNDSTRGVHFHFGHNAEYWTLVRALDILRLEGALRYIPDNNDLWFFHLPPQPPPKNDLPILTCGTSYKRIENRPNKWQVRYQDMKGHLSEYWMILLGYIAIIVTHIYHRKG